MAGRARVSGAETKGGSDSDARSRYPGDWDPWLIWVALVGAALVALAGLRAYLDRGVTEADIEREVERLKARR